MKWALLDWTQAGATAEGNAPDVWVAPWTAALIQEATRSALRAGARADELVGDPADADVTLVELVDRHIRHSAGELQELARSVRAAGRGGAVIVRLHGAWLDHDAKGAASDVPFLGPLWNHVDGVLLGTRGHLVRLASAGSLCPERVRLAPVAIDHLGQLGEDSLSGRPLVLIAGETHRKAMEPILEMLGGMGPDQPTIRFARSGPGFLAGLANASAVIVPALSPFGDRALADTAHAAGLPVIASELAWALDAPLPESVFTVSHDADGAAWSEALAAGLGAGRRSLSDEACPNGGASQRSAGRVGPGERIVAVWDRQRSVMAGLWERKQAEGGADLGNWDRRAAA